MKLSVLNLAVCVSMANAAIANESASATEKESVSTMDTVVVTGEKQERSLKDTISSVSVIGGEKLETTQFVTVRDAIKDTPNVLALDGVVPNIRGVEGNGAAGGFFGVAGGANARVSMLVDGVADPFLAVFSGDSGLWDLEQIEVFRGPQSTNNGRNSIAGSLYLKTKDPTFDWEGKVRLAYRDNKDYFDKAVMISGPMIEDTLAFRFTGQMMDAHTLTENEEYAGNPADYDLNEFNSDKGRLKFLWTPSDDLEALFTYSTGEEQGDVGRRYYTNETDYILAFPQNQKVENDSLSLKIDYAINDSMSIDVLISDKEYTYGFDTYASTAAGEQQFRIDEDSTTFDAKLNFGENSNTLYGHVGFAYFERDQDINSTGDSVYDGEDSSDSKAVYGELNYALSERLTLIGGMRYQKEKQLRNFNFPFFSVDLDLDIDESVFIPSVALQYDVTEDTRVGMSAKKGYNSAGGAVHPIIGIPFTYDKETVNAYELTARSSLADDRVTLSANLFYNDYSGYQASLNGAIVNVQEAETYGLELQTTAMATEDLELSLGLGLLNSEVKDGGSIASISSNDLSFAPEATVTLGATYFVNNNLDVGASLRYTGSYYTDLVNTDSTKVDGYSTLNLTTNYEKGPWLVAGFVNNVTDRHQVTNHAFGTVELLEPRTFGASVTYSFF
ncbi:TonB-dependent receptor [Neptuniibacter sp. SY11_33]|uniref:TonB-dependent receptor n=1 Tax=Neptuniibacter sp. SY11_33 TaxID=3398215 RepID=UPI0039F61165